MRDHVYLNQVCLQYSFAKFKPLSFFFFAQNITDAHNLMSIRIPSSVMFTDLQF